MAFQEAGVRMFLGVEEQVQVHPLHLVKVEEANLTIDFRRYLYQEVLRKIIFYFKIIISEDVLVYYITGLRRTQISNFNQAFEICYFVIVYPYPLAQWFLNVLYKV